MDRRLPTSFQRAQARPRLPLYPTLDSTLIDTTALTPEEVAERIISTSPLLDNGA